MVLVETFCLGFQVFLVLVSHFWSLTEVCSCSTPVVVLRRSLLAELLNDYFWAVHQFNEGIVPIWNQRSWSWWSQPFDLNLHLELCCLVLGLKRSHARLMRCLCARCRFVLQCRQHVIELVQSCWSTAVESPETKCYHLHLNTVTLYCHHIQFSRNVEPFCNMLSLCGSLQFNNGMHKVAVHVKYKFRKFILHITMNHLRVCDFARCVPVLCTI